MNTSIRSALAVLGAGLIALTSGCGKSSSSSSSPAAPPATAAATAQNSGSSIDALDQATKISSDAIISGGTGTTVSTSDVSAGSATMSAQPASGAQARSATAFDFTTSGTLTVDLDAVDGAGHDRFPNATGSFTVSWTGSVVASQPTGTGGTAGYDVTVTYDTDCVFTDPVSGAVATIQHGSTHAYTLELAWSRTDASHWTIDADHHLNVPSFAETLVHGADTWSGALVGNRHEVDHLVDTAGVLSLSRTVVADWTVDLSENAVSHHIVWHRPALDTIYVTVDGTTYGPYTAAQVWWYFHCSCH